MDSPARREHRRRNRRVPTPGPLARRVARAREERLARTVRGDPLPVPECGAAERDLGGCDRVRCLFAFGGRVPRCVPLVSISSFRGAGAETSWRADAASCPRKQSKGDGLLEWPRLALPAESNADAAVSLSPGFSGLFHTMLCHSEDVAVRWNRLDYVGIVVLISGTFVPAVHYGFFCDAHLRNRYIALIYTFAAATTATVVSPHARTPEYRRFRTWIFIAMGCSAVLPVGHAILRYGVRQTATSLRVPSDASAEADCLSSTTGRGRVDGDFALLAGTRRGPLHHRSCAVSPLALSVIVRTAKRMAGSLDGSHFSALAPRWRTFPSARRTRDFARHAVCLSLECAISVKGTVALSAKHQPD